MGGRLGRGRLRWLATVCALVAVGGLVTSARSALSEPTKRVTYKGYRIEVPDSWRVVDLARDPGACVRFDVHAVYLGHPGTQSSCPARVLGRTEALLVEPIDRTSKARASRAAAWAPKGRAASAVPARTGHEVTIGVSQAGVLVTASYGSDPATLDGIVGRATLTSDARPAAELAATTTAATSVVVPKTFNGLGFDACSAPDSAAMQAWLTSSPYRAVGVYIGGISRACAQPNLTAAWVDQQVSNGWNLMPIYVGPQAPCTGFRNRIDPADPASQGRAAAEDAVVSAGSLGMAAGSVLYYDMEGYSPPATDTTCRPTVLSFLSNWSTRLHELGYKSGVYSSADLGIRDLVGVYDSTTFVRPDHVWFARWDKVATVSDPAIPSTYWADHQRIKQYQGGHDETWPNGGGVKINVDSDYLDVATSEPPPPPPVDDGDQDSPAVVTVGTELHAFARGSDKRLYEAAYRSGRWSNWSALGTQTFAGSPSAIRYSTGINLYARGEDQRVYERYLRSGSAWSNWAPHSGVAAAGDPVAVTDGTNISVFARGADQRLYDTTFRPTTRWSAWAAHAGVAAAGNPAVVSLGSEIHVFVRGSDSALYETFYRPSFGWSSWTPHAGRAVAGDPTAVSYGTGGINLFARGVDQRLYETYFRPATGWSSWLTHGGAALDGDPLALVKGTEIHVFARTTADVLAETFYRPGARWTAWAQHGGVTVAGTPAAVLYGSGGINLYMRGGNRLYETYFRPTTGWSAWYVKGGTAVAIA